MGGAIILLIVTVSVVLWGNLANAYIWVLMFVTVGMGLIGFVDDYSKVVKKTGGLKAATKITGQFAVALAVFE